MKHMVYSGHPSQFWLGRQRSELKTTADIEDMKKLTDIVDYDSLHIQRSKGMMCTKEDEKLLKEMQKMQILEKINIERQEQDIDVMWHDVLVQDVRQKEYKEKVDEERRQQEMVQRRRAYDEQIASANRKRQDAIREEREKENRRFERIKQKMEQDHYETMRKKKDQQNKNKINYIEGYEMKVARLREEKLKAREIDNGTIRVALDELQLERERNRLQMKNLQIEKQIFVENFNRERATAVELEDASDRIAQEWKRTDEDRTDEQLRKREEETKRCKLQAAQEYKKHMDKRLVELQMAKLERCQRMEQVKRTAYNELQRKLDSAEDELRRQVGYRNSLTSQLRDNQRFMESESVKTEIKDSPFTKKRTMFKEALEDTLGQRNVTRTSTNPVHPFRRCLNMHPEDNRTKLPRI